MTDVVSHRWDRPQSTGAASAAMRAMAALHRAFVQAVQWGLQIRPSPSFRFESLRAFGESLEALEKERADMIHAIHDRITVAGPEIATSGRRSI